MSDYARKYEQTPGGRPIGGWLIVLGITIAVSSIRGLLFIQEKMPLLFDQTRPESFSPWHFHEIFELMVNVILIILNTISLTMFILRRKQFPPVMISTMMFLCCAILVKSIWLGFLPNSAPIFSESYARKLFQILIFGGWIYYLFNSKRVKQTFVR